MRYYSIGKSNFAHKKTAKSSAFYSQNNSGKAHTNSLNSPRGNQNVIREVQEAWSKLFKFCFFPISECVGVLRTHSGP
jgi:hypothetical protein